MIDMKALLHCAFLLVAGLSLLACEREAPSPWKEMKFPLRHGEVLSGASAEEMTVLFHQTKRRSDLFREFSRALDRSGYKHVRDGKEHDVSADAHSGVFQKDKTEILLTVVAAPGGVDTRVQLKRID
jgi:hypothetical protein